MAHDCKRNGTAKLFAAYSVLDGLLIGGNVQSYRHQELIRFLNVIERDIPAGKMIHTIVASCATQWIAGSGPAMTIGVWGTKC